MYAGTSATGNVYKIAPDGTAKKLAGLPSAAVTSLVTDGSDSVYAAAGGTITKIAPDNSVQTYTTAADPQFISLAIDPQTQAPVRGDRHRRQCLHARRGGQRRRKRHVPKHRA